MKLARFEAGGQTCVGIVQDEQIIDCSTGQPGMDNLAGILHAGQAGRERLQAIIQGDARCLALADVTLLAPIPRPGKFLGVGLNYLDHIEETGAERPRHPTIFNKQATCIIGPGADIEIPRVSHRVDYEGELAMVIGRRCRYVSRQQATEVIGGYTIVNDVSVRDWQGHSPTWTMGKSFDTHGPVGPWVVTADELGDPHQLAVKTWVNDELRQDTHTRHLLFDCYDLVEYLSTAFTLEPGDIIATGTSSGVGYKMSPRGYLQAGDRVRVEIEGIGTLENPVINEADESAFID